MPLPCAAVSVGVAFHKAMMRSWYSVLELHTPRLCTTFNVRKSTSTVSIRCPSIVAERMREFSLR